MKIDFNPAAEIEFAEAVAWYADEAGPGQANDFRNEIHRSLQLLSDHPAMGAPRVGKTRSLVVQRYPYSIVYRVQVDTLRIIAIANQSRRPGYWAGRR